jgi:serine phosphatase RsbU (regulator of sigma subunit)
MRTIRWGLRAKSALALGLCMLVILLLAMLAGWRALQAIEENLGTAYARNLTQYNKQRILTPVLRELALSQQLANSEVTRRWLLDENDPAKKSLFFAEAAHYQKAFSDRSYFLISGNSRNYYFNDKHSAYSNQPRYALRPNDEKDAWFFQTMQSSRDFNINVNPDEKLKVTKVWFNVLVKDGERNLGLAGTGLDLTNFLNRFITRDEAGVTPIIVNREGAIQAYPDRKLINYSSISAKGANRSTIYQLMARDADKANLRTALQRAEGHADNIELLWANLNNQRQLLAIAFLPELNWHVITAVDLKAARVIDSSLWLPWLLVGGALLVLLSAAIVVAVNRILLSPLLKLTGSVRRMAAGHYDVQLPPAGHDELGELTRAFGAMAAQVRSYTDELEHKVQERTQELVAVNEQIAHAHKQIGDSIQYASLIQNAILPNDELARTLQEEYFVLWRPRDVVGGDFYVFRAHEKGCLLGVVDCAGHGVAGAFMTMIAHSAINVAIDTLGIDDPAALLNRMDEKIREMLHADPRYATVATNMDAGLAYLDFATQSVTFAGAKISLYWCDGTEVSEIKGARQAVGGKRQPEFSNTKAPLDPRVTWYLTTDGLLDQAGGAKGFSFGNARFEELMLRHAGRPFAEQKEAFAAELADYQGERSQRDDITVLSFRFNRPADTPQDEAILAGVS